MTNSDTRLKLIARNEGKIKSYESCIDVRAWSHDVATQDRYLKEWMRCDMPVCVIPMSTVLGFLRTMTCGIRGRAAPRCHPDCKSKIILESITNSCQVMKECLKDDEDFEKFFIEEELETSHWPCDRCLEALKNIKLFWKILLEKLFNINISKASCYDNKDNCRNDSVRDVARNWQKEILRQALFVKTVTPQLSSTNPNQKKCDPFCKESNIDETNCTHIPRPPCSERDCTDLAHKSSTVYFCRCKFLKCKDNECALSKEATTGKHCRHILAEVKTATVACNTNDNPVTIEKLKNINLAQQTEMIKLMNENRLLKCELQKVYDEGKRREPSYCRKLSPVNENPCTLLHTFEESVLTDDTSKVARNSESEMVITLQNCKTESFQHVSLLQVLHKTNDPILQEVLPHGPCVKKEDPVCLLNKVQMALGEMVKREMALASNKKKCTDLNTSDIEASFRTVAVCKSKNSRLHSSPCTLN